MSGDRGVGVGVLAALVAVGAVAWWFQLRAPLEPAPASLAALPARLGPWTAEDVPLEREVESMLRADFNVQRAYLSPFGDVVWLYVGYYGTERGGTPEHTPQQCYAAQGYAVRAERALAIDASAGLRARELLVERDGERRLVAFWYRSFRRSGIGGTLALALDHVLGRLLHGRADGALVRLSTPVVAGDEVGARSRLLSLASPLDRAIARHWPRERERP